MRTSLIVMRIEHEVNENSSFIPTCFGTKQKVRKWRKLCYTFFSCSNHNSKNNLILVHIEFQHTTPVESCLGSASHAGPP